MGKLKGTKRMLDPLPHSPTHCGDSSSLKTGLHGFITWLLPSCSSVMDTYSRIKRHMIYTDQVKKSYRGENHRSWIFSSLPCITGQCNVPSFHCFVPQSTSGQSVSFVVWRPEGKSTVLLFHLFHWLISLAIKTLFSYSRITPALKNKGISWRQLNLT